MLKFNNQKGGIYLKLGIIGGSGIYDIEGIIIKDEKKMKTPFGYPSDKYLIGVIPNSKTTIIFLQRHSEKHNIPPHKINYKANIWGFKELGVNRIIAFGASGGIKKGLHPGDFILLDQIIDMTSNRPNTYYEGDTDVVHVDFTEPFCPELRNSIIKSASISRINIKKDGTYICVDGPRLETKAEIKFFSMIGGDVVGMTGMPEAVLARELEICYASVSIITNYAAGITGNKLTVKEVLETMRENKDKIKRLIINLIPILPSERNCFCKYALKDAKM